MRLITEAKQLFDLIPVHPLKVTLDLIAQRIATYATGHFELPQAAPGETLVHLVPVSSGVDSSVTALALKALHPNERIHFVFTDTKFEVEGTQEALDLLESVLGEPIVRKIPDLGLLQLIEAQGNYLPSQRQRYCTRITKIIPFTQYITYLRRHYGADARICSYVGVRADETDREGGQFSASENIHTHFPLQQLGLTREHVYRILAETIGIPGYYRDKSRSGCSICVFSRRSEVIAQMRSNFSVFMSAAKLENLPAAAIAQFSALATSVGTETGIARNHLSYPLLNEQFPALAAPQGYEGNQGTRSSTPTTDLFADQRLFVAVEFESFWDGFQYQVAFQRIITYSTTLSGLKRALKFFWEHRLSSRELWITGSSEADLRDQLRIAIFEISVPEHIVKIGQRTEGAYTWQNDRQALLQIRQIYSIIERALLAEGLRQEAVSGRTRTDRQLAAEGFSRLAEDYGHIVRGMPYAAPYESELVDDIDIEDAPVACNACSR